MRRIQFVLALSLFTLQTSIQGCLGFSSIQTQRILKKSPNFKSQNANKNAYKNLATNNCKVIKIISGEGKNIPSKKYDFLFVNINRNIIFKEFTNI